MPSTIRSLFGATEPWSVGSWVTTDDRVRGGRSQSHLDLSVKGNAAQFHGNLDIKTLGGAGFASQRTADPQHWDLAGFDGIYLQVNGGDRLKYTLILKDETRPRRPDGRESASTSWECDFVGHQSEVYIPWSDFRPTYRGKPKTDARPLNLANIQRFSIMMRSFFGDQQGPFCVEIGQIAAYSLGHGPQMPRRSSSSTGRESFHSDLKQSVPSHNATTGRPTRFWSALFCGLLG